MSARLASSAARRARSPYDNTKIAVARITGAGERAPTLDFTGLKSHFLFEARFGRPGQGNDDGKVEGLVKHDRRNFMTPIPADVRR